MGFVSDPRIAPEKRDDEGTTFIKEGNLPVKAPVLSKL